MFEQHSKSIIGLERLMLEASGFDFRNRYPQKLLLKLARHYSVDRATVGKTAYNMSLDLYRTLAPLKQTAATMAVSCVELAGRLWDQNVHQLEAQNGYQDFRITRTEVMGELHSNYAHCSLAPEIPNPSVQRHYSTCSICTPTTEHQRSSGRIILSRNSSASGSR